MKKIVFMIAALAMINLASCKGEGEKSTSDTTAVEMTTDSISAEDFEAQLAAAVEKKDTAAIEQLVAASQSTFQKMLVSNKEEAEAFAAKVQQAINGNTQLKEILPNVEELAKKVASVPADVAAGAEKAGVALKDSVVKAGVNAAENVVKSAEAQTVAKVKEGQAAASNAVNDKVNEVKEKSNKAVDDAANKAKDALNKAFTK